MTAAVARQGTLQEANERLKALCDHYQENIPGCLGVSVAVDEEYIHEIRIFGSGEAYTAHLGAGDQKVKDLYEGWNSVFEVPAEGHCIVPDEMTSDINDCGTVYGWGEAFGDMYLD